ncbi:cyclin-D6 [Salix suchowensis]|nr:cyclin-D6 [Salix suchowensis]
MKLDLGNQLASSEEHQPDTITYLFASEFDHMPSRNLLDLLETRDFYVSFRQEAISLILQCSDDDFLCFAGTIFLRLWPFVPYLAVNFMDRFISRIEIPEGKPWILRLLVVSCLSLAAKMESTDFSVSNFQGDEAGFIFDNKTVNRMELLILDTLDWRMRSITPFSFLHFFISLSQLKDPALAQTLKGRATEIILKAQNEIKLLKFKPSIIAASALLVASNELLPLQFPSLKCSISAFECVDETLVSSIMIFINNYLVHYILKINTRQIDHQPQKRL